MIFPFSIVELSEKQVAGASVVTDMQNAYKDCSLLWQKFVPLLINMQGEDKTEPLNVMSYGVSQMVDDNRFIYMAAIEVDGQMEVDGFEQESLVAGLYLKCEVPKLSQLKDVYGYIYERWSNEQEDYQLNCMGASIECYPANWHPESPFELHIPIIRK